MATIDEIKRLGQLSDKDHMEEEKRDFPYVGYALRKISPYITRFFLQHNISANQVSTLSIIIGVLANITFTFGDYYLMFLGCFLYQFWNIFDLVDGEIARITNIKTAAGKYLETINMPITECGFITCLGIGLSKILTDRSFIFWGLFFSLCYALLDTFARTRDVMAGGLQTKAEKTKKLQRGVSIKKIYKKARLFFVVINGYLILTLLTLFQLLFMQKLYITFLSLKLNFLSTYFFIYGFLWIIRMVISAITNYQYLIKHRPIQN